MPEQESRPVEVPPQAGEAFVRFCNVIAALRAPDGCPWDQKQTPKSVAHDLIEEACEAVDAIEKEDVDHTREELGDVLLQVIFQSNMAAEAGEFTIEDVINDIHAKIVRRHPHVFGAEEALVAAGFSPEEIAEATTPGKVLDMWDHIKMHERAMEEERRRAKALEAGIDPDAPEGLLEGIPRSLPALTQAQKISKKAVGAGFEWDSVEDVWAQFAEERAEFDEAPVGTDERIEEFGDMLFTLVNVARKEHIDAEEALRRVCTKFRARWAIMEEYAYSEEGASLESLERDQLEALWNRAKAHMRKESR